MTKMRKLKVLILEEYIDTVLRFLVKKDYIRFIDMRKKLEPWKGTLVSYEVPVEITNRCSRLLSRSSVITSKIDKLIKLKEVKLSETVKSKQLSKKKVEEVIDEIEHRLDEFEKKFTLEEERWKEIYTDLVERQTLLDRLRELRTQENVSLENKLRELEEHIEVSKIILRIELGQLKAFANLENQKVRIEKAISEIKRVKLGKIREDLLSIEDTLHKEEAILDAKNQFARTNKTVYFEAFVVSSHVNEVSTTIKDICEDECLVTACDID